MINPNLDYVGSTVSLVSASDIRYVGRLFGVDSKNHIVMLADVMEMGTEGRTVAHHVPCSPDVQAYVVFSGSDIKDLVILEGTKRHFEARSAGGRKQRLRRRMRAGKKCAARVDTK